MAALERLISVPQSDCSSVLYDCIVVVRLYSVRRPFLAPMLGSFRCYLCKFLAFFLIFCECFQLSFGISWFSLSFERFTTLSLRPACFAALSMTSNSSIWWEINLTCHLICSFNLECESADPHGSCSWLSPSRRAQIPASIKWGAQAMCSLCWYQQQHLAYHAVHNSTTTYSFLWRSAFFIVRLSRSASDGNDAHDIRRLKVPPTTCSKCSAIS